MDNLFSMAGDGTNLPQEQVIEPGLPQEGVLQQPGAFQPTVNEGIQQTQVGPYQQQQYPQQYQASPYQQQQFQQPPQQQFQQPQQQVAPQNTPYAQVPYAQQPVNNPVTPQQQGADDFSRQFGVPVAPQQIPAQQPVNPQFRQQPWAGQPQQYPQYPQQAQYPQPVIGQQYPQQMAPAQQPIAMPQQMAPAQQPIQQPIQQPAPQQPGQQRDAQGRFAPIERPQVPTKPVGYDATEAVTDPNSASARYDASYRDYTDKMGNYYEAQARRAEDLYQTSMQVGQQQIQQLQRQMLVSGVQNQLNQWGVPNGNANMVGTQEHFLAWANQGNVSLETLFRVYQGQFNVQGQALQQARLQQAQQTRQAQQMFAPIPNAGAYSAPVAPSQPIENAIFDFMNSDTVNMGF